MIQWLCIPTKKKRGSHRFSDFVDKTFALLSNSPVKKFSLCHDGENSRVNRCIWTAMERGLFELHLHSRSVLVVLETKLLTSNTLVKLTISGECDLDVERVFFSALKSLSLISFPELDHPNYSRLLDGCPVLEELFISDAHDLHPPCCGASVESASIKRLVVFEDLPAFQKFHDIVFIEAPSLVYLDYSSYVSESYQFVDLDLLVEARLSLKLWEPANDYDNDDFDSDDDSDSDDDDDDDSVFDEPKEAIFGDVTDLVAGISNITTLHLSHDSLEGLVHRVTSRCGDACACIPKRRRKQKKNNKRKIVKKEICCLWTCQVKVLEISEFGGSFQELKQMRHFLGKLKCLETVKVGVHVDSNNSKYLRANVMALPRVSSKCNIRFI